MNNPAIEPKQRPAPFAAERMFDIRRRSSSSCGAPCVLLLLLPDMVQAQFIYTADGGAISVARYVGLTRIVIPASINAIGIAAFGNCANLTALTVDSLNPVFSSTDGVLFSKDESVLMGFPSGTAGSFTVPDIVTGIAPYAFDGCTGLTNVTIGKNVTGIGASAFARCTNLTTLTVDPINVAYGSVDGVLFGPDRTTLLLCPEGRSGSYAIPGVVVTIGTNAFDSCRSLTNITLPGSVTGIRRAAFRDCTGLARVTFGFRVSWATNLPVVVEACTDLTAPEWSPVSTNTLVGGWTSFDDPQWTNHPNFRYRVRSP